MSGKKLTNHSSNKKGVVLTNNKDYPFIIVIGPKLEKKYGFSEINKNNGYKEFQRFLNDTVYKGLTITQVDKVFLRTRGPKEEYKKGDVNTTLHHYGRDGSKFRLFGYYDPETNYFVLTKIDCNHKVHKS